MKSCKNVQTLTLEVFKVAENFSAPIVSKIFEKRNNVYNLRNLLKFVLLKVHSLFHSIESISNLGPQFWKMVPLEMKKLIINAFKRKLRNGSQKTAHVGYVNHTCKA